MSTVYDEGPFRNWTAVNFPSDRSLTCTFNWGLIIFPNRGLASPDGEATGDTDEDKVAPYRKAWIGTSSSVIIDFTLAPILPSPQLYEGYYFVEGNLADNTVVVLIWDEADNYNFTVDEALVPYTA